MFGGLSNFKTKTVKYILILFAVALSSCSKSLNKPLFVTSGNHGSGGNSNVHQTVFVFGSVKIDTSKVSKIRPRIKIGG